MRLDDFGNAFEESWPLGFPKVALRKELLRQHYLDQVLGSFAFRAKLSAFVVPADGRLAPRFDKARMDDRQRQVSGR